MVVVGNLLAVKKASLLLLVIVSIKDSGEGGAARSLLSILVTTLFDSLLAQVVITQPHSLG